MDLSSEKIDDIIDDINYKVSEKVNTFTGSILKDMEWWLENNSLDNILNNIDNVIRVKFKNVLVKKIINFLKDKLNNSTIKKNNHQKLNSKDLKELSREIDRALQDIEIGNQYLYKKLVQYNYTKDFREVIKGDVQDEIKETAEEIKNIISDYTEIMVYKYFYNTN